MTAQQAATGPADARGKGARPGDARDVAEHRRGCPPHGAVLSRHAGAAALCRPLPGRAARAADCRPDLAPVPGRFDDFRFSDHLVWLLILGLIGLLFAGETPLAGPAASLVAFGVGLYALRGSAVLATALRYAPRLFVVMLVVGAFFCCRSPSGGSPSSAWLISGSTSGGAWRRRLPEGRTDDGSNPAR